MNDAHWKRRCTNRCVRPAQPLPLVSKQSLLQRQGSHFSLVQTVLTTLQGLYDFQALTLRK